MSKRTWEISWFVWNNGKGVKTKSVFKTVNTSDYIDRDSEKAELTEQVRTEYNLNSQKIVMINQAYAWDKMNICPDTKATTYKYK